MATFCGGYQKEGR